MEDVVTFGIVATDGYGFGGKVTCVIESLHGDYVHVRMARVVVGEDVEFAGVEECAQMPSHVAVGGEEI